MERQASNAQTIKGPRPVASLPAQSRWRSSGKDWAPPVLLVVGIMVLWQYAPTALNIEAYILPPFSDVVSAGHEARDRLWEALLVTTQEVILAFAIAVVLGILLGVLISGSTVIRRTVYPLLIGFQGLPKVALAPLFVIWFGYEMQSKVLMAVLFAIFPIVIGAIGGLSDVPRHMEEHFRALRASRWATFRKLRVPYALPALLDGCKVALPLAIIGAIVGEFVAAQVGIGVLIQVSAATNQTDLVFAALIVVTLLSFILYGLLGLVSRFVWWRGLAA